MQALPGQHVVATPNPEILLDAHRDKKLRGILNSSSLNLPDGIGLALALRLKGRQMPERVTGVDTAQLVCGEAGKRGWNVGIFGGWEGSERFRSVAPCALRVWQEDADILRDNPSLNILFVALGGGKQEYWTLENLPRLKRVKTAMMVGGAFDMLSGRIPRAPLWMRAWGCEWLWRWYQEPWRTKRIMRSTILFPLAVIKEKQNI